MHQFFGHETENTEAPSSISQRNLGGLPFDVILLLAQSRLKSRFIFSYFQHSVVNLVLRKSGVDR